MPIFKGESLDELVNRSKKLQNMRLSRRNELIHRNIQNEPNTQIEDDNVWFYENIF